MNITKMQLKLIAITEDDWRYAEIIKVLDRCHTIHVYSIEPDNALCENAVTQNEFNFQNL